MAFGGILLGALNNTRNSLMAYLLFNIKEKSLEQKQFRAIKCKEYVKKTKIANNGHEESVLLK